MTGRQSEESPCFTEVYTLLFGGSELEWDEDLALGVVQGLCEEFNLWSLTSLQRRFERAQAPTYDDEMVAAVTKACAESIAEGGDGWAYADAIARHWFGGHRTGMGARLRGGQNRGLLERDSAGRGIFRWRVK